MQIPTITNTNLITNPSFELVTSTSYLSGFKINVNDSILTGEFARSGTPGLTDVMSYDATKVLESVSVSLQNAINKPSVSDSTATYETIAISLNLPNGTTGWTGFNSVISLDSSTAYVGIESLKVVGNAGHSAVAVYTTTMTIGVAYSAQARVKGTLGQTAYILCASNGAGSGFTLTGGWDLITYSFTPTVSSSSVEVHNDTLATTIHIDAIMLEKNISPSSYFDGNSGTGYAWTGTTNNSTSTYTAFTALATSNAISSPQYGALIDWTRALNPSATFFTINQSSIGGSDFIPGTQSFPTYSNRYAYTDYSSYLLSVSIQKDIGQFPYGIFSAQMTLVLDNTSLLFQPGFDPTIGSFILTGRPVQFSIGFGGEFINWFAGASTKPANDLQSRTTTLIAFDGSDYLNSFVSQGAGPLALLNNGNYVSTSAEIIIGDLLQEAGFTSTQYVAEQSLQATPIGFLPPLGLTVGSIIQQICEAEQAFFFFDENGVAHFWNNQHIQQNQTPVWTFDYTQIVNFTLEDTPIINDVIVTSLPRMVQINQPVWQLSGSSAIPAGASATIEADFTDSYGALPAVTVDPPAYGGVTSTYSTNTAPDGSGINQNTSISLTAVSLIGSTYLMTFSNTYTQPIYITAITLYGTPARVAQVINTEFTNSLSIQTYGTNPSNNGLPLTISNNLIQSSDTANSDAYTLVTNYSTPYQRMTVDVFSVPQLQFGDVVNVLLSDTGQQLQYTIVGISNGVNNDGEVIQTLDLNIYNIIHYFTINVSAIAGTDSIAP